MIVIAQIGAPFGVQGYLKINSYTDPFDQVLRYQPWFVKSNHDYQQLHVAKAKIQSNHIIIRPQDCTDRNQAALYTNTMLYVPRSVLPALPADEYYLNDLEGLTIYLVNGTCLGVVQWVMETGANEVLVVWDAARKKEHLIPFLLHHTIVSIDMEQKAAYVNWDPEF